MSGLHHVLHHDLPTDDREYCLARPKGMSVIVIDRRVYVPRHEVGVHARAERATMGRDSSRSRGLRGVRPNGVLEAQFLLRPPTPGRRAIGRLALEGREDSLSRIDRGHRDVTPEDDRRTLPK